MKKKSINFKKIYVSKYYNSDNYINYNGLRYRFYHLFRYLYLGLIYKYIFGVKSILDIGCANGMSVWVFRKFLRIDAYGVDVSEYAIENSIVSVRNYIKCLDIQADNLKVFNKKFDLVVSYDSIEHLETEKISYVVKNIFSISDKAIFGIYVLDENVAKIHNLLGIVHKSHFSEYTSSWWIDKFSKSNIVATNLPFARKGSLLVRKKVASYWA